MTDPNQDSSNHESSMVVSPPAEEITPTPTQTDAIRQETAALIDAIRKRALAEIQTAGDLTRETYLNAVRQAREAVEQTKLIEPDRIEQSIHQIQQEAEHNWQSVVKEVEDFGQRLSEAAKAAWEKLIPPQDH